LNEKYNIEKLKKNYVYNFNPTNECNNEWENLQSKLKKTYKIHEIEQYDLTYVLKPPQKKLKHQFVVHLNK